MKNVIKDISTPRKFTKPSKYFSIFNLKNENLYNFHNNLPILPERMKIETVKRIMAYLRDEVEYVIYTRNLKQVLNHILPLRKSS